MTNTGRNAMAVLVAALVTLGAVPAGAQDEAKVTNDQPEATIVLHVVNLAALSRDFLNVVRDRVALVYERIGVRIVWVESEQAARKHLDSGLRLTVILLSRDIAQRKISAKGISNDALGVADPVSGRAYIFCHRIAAMPGLKLFAMQFSAVIAHEVGHLVLPDKSHSRSGIMRAELDARHAIHLQTFDKSQASSIRTMLLELSADAGWR